MQHILENRCDSCIPSSSSYTTIDVTYKHNDQSYTKK